ncbi:MAG: GDP-mannose 4,6-dehydratase [Propionibacteriaceae bacterium]|jgi:GDPmannose 4,6-dehydratase|nr:GDP-mannose 4,6-dehydratase [Propionibacteriaceae bacterium]
MTARRAFITGLAGQDGSYLAERLVADGYSVHGLVLQGEPLDNLSGVAERVTLHVGDLRDSAAIESLVESIVPNEIYNLGGISSVALSWDKPALTASVSGAAVAGLLASAWKLHEAGEDVSFVQASSAEIFGNPSVSPQNENTPLNPISPYGAAKAFAHDLVRIFRDRGLHASNAILYNHESTRRPQTFVTRKITSTVARIAAGREAVLSLGNIAARRDWGWAPDYVAAISRIPAAEPSDYLLATGVAHSVEEFVAAAFASVGISDYRAHIEIDEQFFRPIDAPALVGDSSKAQDQLDFVHSLTFEELVAGMVGHDAEMLNEDARL